MFKEFHVKNSKEIDPLSSNQFFSDYRELLSPKSYEEDYNWAYLQIKNLISKKYSNNENISGEKSFIIYLDGSSLPFPSHKDSECLDLLRYLNIIKKSQNYLEYIENLKKISLLPFFASIKLDDLHGFCNSIKSDIINIVNIKKSRFDYLYLDQEEERNFDKNWLLNSNPKSKPHKLGKKSGKEK